MLVPSETILWEGGSGFFLLERHLARLAASADYFGYDISVEGIRRELEAAVSGRADDTCVLRLLAAGNGDVEIQLKPVPTPKEEPFTLAVAKTSVTSTDAFLYHKTTHRAVYQRARDSMAGCDDVILRNERDELTETTIANLVLKLDGQLVTPPVESGLLAGTFRDQLLDEGKIVERVLTLDNLADAEEVFLINSVRKWVRGRIIDG